MARSLLILASLLFVCPAATAAEPEAPPSTDVVVLHAEAVPADGVFRWFPDWRPAAAPRWALALGGGGAWGLAHVGLLDALDQDGLAPDMLAGTSIGALIGSLAASGYSPREIEDAFRATDWNVVLTRNPRPEGLSVPDDPLEQQRALISTGRRRDGKRLPYRGIIPDRLLDVELMRFLSRAASASEGDLDRLAIPFRAVSTDLVSGSVYAPRTGSLPLLVRASIGLPVFRPLAYDGRLLVDGGSLENVPARTARAMGADVVIASQLTSAGENLAPAPEISSLTGLVGRTFEVSYADQRRSVLESADVLVNLAVGDVPFMDFGTTNLPPIIQRGRDAWRTYRERVLAALEQHAKDPRRFDVRAVEAGEGVGTADAHEVAARLGLDGAARPVSALRLELELVRLLKRSGAASGAVDVHPDGRVVLRMTTGATVRALTIDAPASLKADLADVTLAHLGAPTPAAVMRAVNAAMIRSRQRGLFLCGVDRVAWDASTGSLHVVLDEGRFARIESRSLATGKTTRHFDPLVRDESRRAEIGALQDVFVDLYQDGQLSNVNGLDITRQSDGRYNALLQIDEPPMWEFALQPGFNDALGAVVWTRFSFPSLAGWKHWDLDLRLAAWRLGVVFGFEVAPPRSPFFFRIMSSRVLEPHYNEGGDLIGSRPYWAQAGSAGLRTTQGRFGRAEALLVIRNVDDAAFAEPPGVGTGRPADEKPDETSNDLALDLTWSGDRRDDPARPTSGLLWSVSAITPLYGSKRAALLVGDVAWHVPLSRRISIALLGRASEAQKDRPLPLDRWTDPGSWWEAPRLLPGRGLSPSVRRGTIAARVDLGSLGGTAISAGASAATWTLGDVRIDPTVAASGHGYSLFAEGTYGRFGPVTVGFTWGTLEGNAVFVLASPARAPWAGPRIQLPGR